MKHLEQFGYLPSRHFIQLPLQYFPFGGNAYQKMCKLISCRLCVSKIGKTAGFVLGMLHFSIVGAFAVR